MGRVTIVQFDYTMSLTRRKAVFMDNQKFGQFIMTLRKENGWTQLELAEKLHVTDKAVSKSDTAGGLDNKKRRYAPRGGVAYRLFLWGFPKGAKPPFGTRLCEAKCSVLYLLAWLTGETGCGAFCAPFAPAGKQAEFL